MPFLQFLSGARDQEVEELSDTHSAYLGAGGDPAQNVQVTLQDAGIQPVHCQIYPSGGQFWLKGLGTGSTVVKMRRIGPQNMPDTVPLEPGEVFILGSTYVKFWSERPPAGGGGGGSAGADPAELKAAQARVSELEAELQAAREGAGSAAGAAQQEAEAAKQELEAAKKELEAAKQELEAAKQATEAERADLQGQIEAAQQEAESAKQEIEGAKQEAEAAKQELESERARLEGEVETAKSKAAASVEEAASAAAEERKELEDALAASRAALAGLESEREALTHDRLAAAQSPSDLAEILDAIGVSDALRRRLEQAVAAETDREVLRRAQGPVVPLRGLSLPGSTRDLETELRAARQRAEQVACARELDLGALEADELQRLIELAQK